MKVTIIAGARPNFMKIAPLMRAIKAAKAAGAQQRLSQRLSGACYSAVRHSGNADAG